MDDGTLRRVGLAASYLAALSLLVALPFLGAGVDGYLAFLGAAWTSPGVVPYSVGVLAGAVGAYRLERRGRTPLSMLAGAAGTYAGFYLGFHGLARSLPPDSVVSAGTGLETAGLVFVVGFPGIFAGAIAPAWWARREARTRAEESEPAAG